MSNLAVVEILSFYIPEGLKKGGSFLLTARSFLLTVGLCYLRWSFLLKVKIWLGLFY